MKLSDSTQKEIMSSLVAFISKSGYGGISGFEQYLKKINLNFKKNDSTQSELEVEE
jgi:hypothetical protein